MIGKEIGQYKIVEKLGSGGMGVVYKADDTRLKRKVALKFLPPMFSDDQTSQKRFEHEAQSASALDHPNICTIYEIADSQDGQSFIVMAYYKGHSLNELIESANNKESDLLSVDEIIDIVLQIASGLSRTHEEGIIHRDIKPANIMRTDRGEIKILDFGLAKLTGQSRLTQIGATVGTIGYMSPEQTRGDETDQRTDIWSLGVVMYELITGKRPFQGDYDQAVIYSILNEKAPPLSDFRNDIPSDIQIIIDKMLAKDVDQRYQSIEELITDLKKVNRGQDMNAGPLVSKKKRLNLSLRNFRSIFWTLISVISILILIFLFRSPAFDGAFSDKPTGIAVIDFKNQTGESEFDYFQVAIPNLLIASLEQSPKLRVITWEKLNDLRRQMQPEDSLLIDGENSFTLYQRAGVEIVITGSVIRAGDTFATTIQMLDARNRNLVHSDRVQGEGVSSIIESQIDVLSAKITRELGISSQSLQESVRSIEEITTTSMEAYNFYLRGKEDYALYNFDSARDYFRLALDKDSTFASAYLALALTNLNLGNPKERNWALGLANDLSGHTTFKEKLYIKAFVSRYFEGDSEKFAQILHELIDHFPNELEAYYFLSRYYYSRQDNEKNYQILNVAYQLDPNSVSPTQAQILNLLSYACIKQRDFDRALKLNDRYMKLTPGEWNAYHSRGEILFYKGDLDEAVNSLEMMYKISGPEWSGMKYFAIAYIWAISQNYESALEYFYKESTEEALELASPVRIAQKYFFLTIFQSLLGDYEQSEVDFAIANEFYLKTKSPFLEFWIEYTRAWNYYIRGNYTDGIKFLKMIRNNLDPGELKIYHAQLAMFYARNGVSDSSSWHIKQAEHLYRQEDKITDYDYRMCYAEYLFQVDSIDKAIQIADNLRRTDVMGLAPLLIGFNYNIPFYLDILPRAHAHSGNIIKAISAYEDLIDVNPQDGEYNLTPPIYYYRLAKLYEKNGNKYEAMQNYNRFLEIWKNASDLLPEKKDTLERLKALAM